MEIHPIACVEKRWTDLDDLLKRTAETVTKVLWSVHSWASADAIYCAFSLNPLVFHDQNSKPQPVPLDLVNKTVQCVPE